MTLCFLWVNQQIDSADNLQNPGTCKSPDFFNEVGFIDRQQLRHIYDAILRKVAFSLSQKHISRRRADLQIRRKRTNNRRLDQALIEEVILNYDVWMLV